MFQGALLPAWTFKPLLSMSEENMAIGKPRGVAPCFCPPPIPWRFPEPARPEAGSFRCFRPRWRAFFGWPMPSGTDESKKQLTRRFGGKRLGEERHKTDHLRFGPNFQAMVYLGDGGTRSPSSEPGKFTECPMSLALMHLPIGKVTWRHRERKPMMKVTYLEMLMFPVSKLVT